MKTMKKIVITGAKGFVGSVLTLRAAELGLEVLALDNEQRGLNDVDKLRAAGAHFLAHDCMEGIAGALKHVGWDHVDAVFHLAAATGSLEKPLEELLSFNVGMTQSVYADALSHGCSAFVWPTTSLALGVPDSSYCISKERAREWLIEADKEANIAIPVRFFNVAGAYKGMTELRKDEVHILPVLMDAHLKNTAFTINGSDYDTDDGTPSRDFVNVLDVAEELLFLADCHGIGGPEGRIICPLIRDGRRHAADGAIWLGTGVSTTTAQIVALFEQYIGSVKVIQGPRRPFDCGSLAMDDNQVDGFGASRNTLVPPRVSLRDELVALKAAAEKLDVMGPQAAAQ